MALSKETILDVVRPVCASVDAVEHHDQLTLLIPIAEIVDVCRELRDNSLTQFTFLVDITAIDWNKKNGRFEVVYFLQSMAHKARVRLKVALPNDEHPHCPTVVGIWEAADWFEREAYDMYGVKFDGHPDLRRFYMPEDFVDPSNAEPIYPLRKDFPLMGIPGSLPLPPMPEII
ncbi:MAG: NADH-quinone oxidoreductase subunit C [Ignavibacteriae bacterium]|nr:NADH-quinone oxidoreductase subunit C [Ignavibacteriota bacterium]